MKLSNLFDPHSTTPNTRPTIAVLTSCGTLSQPYNAQISRQLTEARSQLGTQSKAYRALRAISHVLESQKLFENDPEISDTSIWLYTEGCQSALHILLDNHTAKITWLGSLNGTGRQLLEQGLAQSKKQGASLAVVKPIWNSHKFYEQMGFQDQGTGYWNLPLVESANQLDRADLEDLLGEIKYEQEEIDNASYDAAGSKYEKLDQDFKALEAVAYVVKNNLRALDDPKLGKNSIFLYNYTPDLGVFSVTAIHVVIENQVAHVKWLGSYDNKPGAGKALMLQALTVAKNKGATKSVVEAKWESEGFYHKLGYDVEHRGSDNPFTGTSLVQMGKKLEEGWSEEDQRMVHKNPTIQDLKRLARNNKYHSARFVIYKDGSVVAADSEHYTHHSAAPAIGAWALRGYVQYLGGNDYAYRSMEVYSPKSVDHPIFRVWERAGIENGNPDHQRNQISEDSNIDVHNLSIDQLDELMQRNQGKYTFNIPRRALNVANLIRKGAIFVTYPHSKQGWKKDKRDWSYSLITLYNVHGRGWAAQSSQYKKPNSYQGAIQTINHSLPNLGNTDLVYDNKYLQILWSAKKLGLNDREIYLTPELQEAVEKSQNNPQQLYHATLIDNVPSILQAGLTPRVGKIAGGLYKDRAKPLVFATDLQGARRCYCALMSQINMKIGHMPNAEEVAQHGALLIISKDVDKFHQYSAGAKRRKGSIEPGDHYSEEPIRVDQVIKGNDLVKWIKQHQFDQAAGLPLVELDTDTVEENWTKK